MQCVILAGGLGTRMASISEGLPKALLPVGDQTFIQWQLRWLHKIGISSAVLALGHEGEAIQSFIEEQGAPIPVEFSFDGPKLLGTGGAIRKACPILDPDFYVTYGDTIVFLDAQKLRDQHLQSQKGLTLAIHHNKNVADKSNVRFDGQTPYYNKFQTTPDMEYVDYGISMVNKRYFLEQTPEGAFDFATFQNHACNENQAAAFVAKDFFHEIGSPQGYKNFCHLSESQSLEELFQNKVEA